MISKFKVLLDGIQSGLLLSCVSTVLQHLYTLLIIIYTTQVIVGEKIPESVSSPTLIVLELCFPLHLHLVVQWSVLIYLTTLYPLA